MYCIYNDKKHAKNLKKIIEGPVSRLNNHRLARELGYNDEATLAWLFSKANHRKPWDPQNVQITGNDVGRLSDMVEVFIRRIDSKQGGFLSYFKLPKALMRYFPQGDDFVTSVNETVSYGQRHMKESSIRISEMTTGLYKMISEYSGGELSKKDLKSLRQWENALANAVTVEQRNDAMTHLNRIVGQVGDPNAPALGKILRRFQGLLSGTNGEKPIVPKTPTEENIVRNWNLMRAETLKDLLSGAVYAKRLIEIIGDGTVRTDLTRALERVKNSIDALLIQSNIDSKNWTSQYKYENGIVLNKELPGGGDAIQVYNPKTRTYENYTTVDPKDPTKKIMAQGFKKYSPTYVIELTNMISDIVYMGKKYRDIESRDTRGKSPQDLAKLIEDATTPTALSDRLKLAGETDKYSSLDPIYYLNKYANDVSSFNTSTRINMHFAEHTMDIIKRIRANNTGKNNVDVGEYSSGLLDMLFHIRESSINQGRAEQGSMDHVVRMINAFEYVSKMGFGIKSPVKNLTQWLFNFSEWGAKGIGLSSKFKTGSDREWDPNDPSDKRMTNEEMSSRQKKRFGLKIGDKNDAANIAAATQGSLDMMLVPEGFDINKRGQLVISGTQNVAKESLKLGAKYMSAIAGYSSKRTLITATIDGATLGLLPKDIRDNWLNFGSQQWSENFNRIQTFDIAFANAFMIESSASRKDYHRRQIIKEKLDKGVINPNVTTKELYDRIENTSGNIAKEAVSIFHFDYDNWAKARILQGKTGKVVGQYQHFTFSYFDLMHQYVSSAFKDIKGLRWFDPDPETGQYIRLEKGNMRLNPLSHNIQRMYRAVGIQMLLPGVIGAAFGIDIGGFWSTWGIAPPWASDEDKKRMKKQNVTPGGGLLEDPIQTKAKQFYDWMASDFKFDPNKSYQQNVKAKEKYQQQKYGSFYGKNPIVGNLGPFASDIFMFAELMDWYNQTPEEFEKKKHYAYDTDDPQWRYNVARIFNVEAARGYYRVLPNIMSGNLGGIFKSQFGTYGADWQKDWREENANEFEKKMIKYKFWPKKKDSNKTLSKKRQSILLDQERESALNALGNIKY